MVAFHRDGSSRRQFLLAASAASLASLLPGRRAMAAEETRRIALVVGNSTYRHIAPLTNPANDATDIAAKLKKLKFEVLLATNATHAELAKLLGEFKAKVTREHIALVFFAGHGVTLNRESFLVPVDTPAVVGIDETGEARTETLNSQLVSMASVLQPLESSKIGIVFLDACRTNVPGIELSLKVVSKASNRSVQLARGAASMPIAPSPYSAGVFRAYATQLDNVASDGDGRNSPFTKALLKFIDTKGLSIQELMIRVRKEVMAETHNEQVPWEEAALNETFYFAPQEGQPSVTSRPAVSRGESSGSSGSSGSSSSRPARSEPEPRRAASSSGSRPSGGGGGGGGGTPPNLGVGVGAGF